MQTQGMLVSLINPHSLHVIQIYWTFQFLNFFSQSVETEIPASTSQDRCHGTKFLS